MTTPAPGIYPTTPVEEYFEWEAASNSQLKVLANKTPAHLQAYRAKPPETKALLAGRVIHCAILEPEELTARYVKAGKCQAELQSGKRKGEPCGNGSQALHRTRGWLCGQHVGGTDDFDTTKCVVPYDDYEAAIGIRDTAFRMRTIQFAMSSGMAELSMVWNESETGVLTKGRLDWVAPQMKGGGCVLDIKSCEDASEREFMRTLYEYGYHMQGGLYMDGTAVLGVPARHYAIIAAEKKFPYCIATYRLDEGALDAGIQRARPLLRQFARCSERNDWHGYKDEFVDISIPHYGFRDTDEAIRAS